MLLCNLEQPWPHIFVCRVLTCFPQAKAYAQATEEGRRRQEKKKTASAELAAAASEPRVWTGIEVKAEAKTDVAEAGENSEAEATGGAHTLAEKSTTLYAETAAVGVGSDTALPVSIASFLAALPSDCSHNGARLPALGYCWSQTPGEVQREGRWEHNGGRGLL